MRVVPCFPTKRKNHILPVRFRTRGIAYPGVRRRLMTVWRRVVSFARSKEDCGCGGCCRLLKSTAARRINGVVNPHASPTRMKERM